MKKILCFLALATMLSSSAFADFNSDLQKIITQKSQTDVKIIKVYPLKASKDVVLAVFENQANGLHYPVFASKDAQIIFINAQLFSQNDEDEKQFTKILADLENFNENVIDKKLISLFKSFKETDFITFKGGAKTLIVVSDPNCPYCKKELENLNERLKEYTVKYIFAPVLGEDSAIRSQLIMQEAQQAKTNEQKLKILEKYYSKDYKLSSKEAKTAHDLIDKRAQKIFETDIIRSVPYLYELD